MERSIARHTLRIARSTTRPTSSHHLQHPTALSHAPNQHVRFRSSDSNSNSNPDNQVYPLTGFYAELLNSKKPVSESPLASIPKDQVVPETRTQPAPPEPESLPKTDKDEVIEKARVVFGSRLTGPQDHRDEIEKASQDVAGVKVPPKPAEPDDCCMSGCVNCVWDIYRDDLEEWAAKSGEAKQKILAQRKEAGTEGKGVEMPTPVESSIDDDGGGSDTNWDEAGKEDLFENVPVGIREFMRTEKMLKQQKQAAQEKSVGGD